MKLAKLLLIPVFGTLMSASSAAAPRAAPVPVQAAQIENSHISYPGTVLELFTSQGCSSCPRANKFVREAATKPGVLALSYSVDYWDYLGWKDTLSKPEFSARQRQYGKQFNGKVYTPQMVLNGAKHKSRFSQKQLRKQLLSGAPRAITLSETQKGLLVNVNMAAYAAPVTIMAVRYTLGEHEISVKRGENRGRTVKLANVVTSCKKIGTGKPGHTFSARLKSLAPGEAYAILVQSKDGGPVLSAASYLP